MYVYVASSWRNEHQPGIIELLRDQGIDCYDFKNPAGGTGFHWSEVMDDYIPGSEKSEVHEYLKALEHPRSIEGFNSDFEAMEKADTCILVLPCGRSAHLELGWFVGQSKRTAILLDGTATNQFTVVPELMYKMVDHVTNSISSLMDWLEEI